MKQAEMLSNEELWTRARALVDRYNRLRAHFETFAKEAASLAEPEGLGANVTIDLCLADNYFDVNFVGRVFRFRFAPLAAPVAGGDAAFNEGRVVVVEFDPVADEEMEKFEEVTFNGSGRTNLLDPLHGDSINVQTDVGARYLVLHAIYDAIRIPGRAIRAQ
jgi:hypothetical protein